MRSARPLPRYAGLKWHCCCIVYHPSAAVRLVARSVITLICTHSLVHVLLQALCDYLLYHDHNPRKALELAAEATRVVDFKDWWWKARLGKCYYKLGMFRDAEKQFKSALKEANIINVWLELCKVYVKLDQPNTAIENYVKGLEAHVNDPALMTGIARIHSMMNNVDKAVTMYKKVRDDLS